MLKIKHLSVFLFTIIYTSSILAQATDPTPFVMAGGASYSLTSHSGTSFPENMAIGNQDNSTDGNFTNDITNNAPNGTAAGQWNAEGANGISYQGSASGHRASFLLALNTNSRRDIVVQWTVTDINANSNTNYIELQYRIGDSGTFTNLTGDGPYQQGTTSSGTSYSVTLPAAANDVPVVHVRWIYYENGSGVRDRLSVDEISVTSSLPITLKSFNANLQNDKVNLSFTTATEINNDYFSIERSADGAEYAEIGQVKGAGTSYEPQDYTYTDARPLQGKNYYRLRQVDFDGRFSYSPVVTATIGKSGGLSLAPVPTLHSLRVQLDEPSSEEGVWEVFDAAGRLAQSGAFPAETIDYQLDVAALPEGAYAFRLTQGQKVTVQQFRKIR
jgi:hypothetical protein